MTTTDEVMELVRVYADGCELGRLAQGVDAHTALRIAVSALVAERDAMKAALMQVTESLDRLGDQSDVEVSPRVWTKYECQARIDAARSALEGKP